MPTVHALKWTSLNEFGERGWGQGHVQCSQGWTLFEQARALYRGDWGHGRGPVKRTSSFLVEKMMDIQD